MIQDKAEDAGGLPPAKDGNAALHHLNPRTLSMWYFDDRYKDESYGGKKRCDLMIL